MTTHVVWTEKAERSLRRLDRELVRRLRQAVMRLAETGHGDLVRLKPPFSGYRLRVGEWRMFVDLDNDSKTIIVLDVRPRGGAYNRD